MLTEGTKGKMPRRNVAARLAGTTKVATKAKVAKAAKAAKTPKAKKINGSRLEYTQKGATHGWTLYSRNGRPIAKAGGYANKLGAKRAWESVKTAVDDEKTGKLSVV